MVDSAHDDFEKSTTIDHNGWKFKGKHEHNDKI